MAEFLDPTIWQAGVTPYSADNLNHVVLESANNRVLADYAAIAASQPSDLASFRAKMNKYNISIIASIARNTDTVVAFPDGLTKDNTDYGVSITYMPRNRNESILGWAGDIRNGKSLNVVSKQLDSVTVRFQSDDGLGGNDELLVLISCVGGIDFWE